MKRLLLLLMLLWLALASNAFAVGTCTASGPSFIHDTSFSTGQKDAGVYVVTYTCTADVSAHTFPSTVISGTATASKLLWGWYLYSVETLSGATQITNSSSYTIKDASGFDLMGTKGASAISNSTTVGVKTFAFPASGGFSPTVGPLTLAITGNSVDSAVVTVELTFVK